MGLIPGPAIRAHFLTGGGAGAERFHVKCEEIVLHHQESLETLSKC